MNYIFWQFGGTCADFKNRLRTMDGLRALQDLMVKNIKRYRKEVEKEWALMHAEERPKASGGSVEEEEDPLSELGEI